MPFHLPFALQETWPMYLGIVLFIVIAVVRNPSEAAALEGSCTGVLEAADKETGAS